jgi:ABC-2 type transport system permease protein
MATDTHTPALPRTPPAAQRVFQELRWSLLRGGWRAMLGQPATPGGVRPGGGSWTRPVTILVVSFFVAAFVFGLSLAGFWFLRYELHLQFDGNIVRMLSLELLFIVLGVLLVFSTSLILYGSLFTGYESAFLLSQPIPEDQIFAFKYQGAVAFGSWAFVLLGGPILVAYGIIGQAPYYFYLLLPLFFFGFILLPGSLGSLATLLVVNFLPRQRRHVLTLVIGFLLAVIGIWIYQRALTARQLLDPGRGENREVILKLLGALEFVNSALLPSHWAARGVRSAAQGRLSDAAYELLILWTNGLFLYLVAAWAAKKLYRRGYDRITAAGTERRRYRVSRLDQLIEAALWWARPATRLLIVKDFRTFRRDPQQWAQILVIGGLMALYFANARGLWVSDMTWFHQNLLSVLNLCAIGLLICTWTGRFVYPLISLEGKKFWILGLLPLERRQLLWGKFAFSAAGCILTAVGLVLLSDGMLAMPREVVLLHLLTVLVLAMGLSGLSVGLGACMPNFRETDPSKIAVGFGGTLNLVACLGFVVGIFVLMVAPWHLQMALRSDASDHPLLLWPISGIGIVGGLVAGALVIFIPLRAGIRILEKMEF